ncbi:hypothetical protein ACUOA5_45675, partial [Escherichia coli]
HVIVESLLAGCPVIISDQTPWKNIEHEGAGWTIPLEKEETFISALNDIVHMDSERFQQLHDHNSHQMLEIKKHYN